MYYDNEFDSIFENMDSDDEIDREQMLADLIDEVDQIYWEAFGLHIIAKPAKLIQSAADKCSCEDFRKRKRF